MSKSKRNFDNLPELEDKVIFWRLVALVAGCVALVYSGFWLLENHLLHTLTRLQVFVREYWDLIGTAVFWKGMFAWIKTMWWRWLFIEVPKRWLMFGFLPYMLIQITPRKWLRWPRRMLRNTIVTLLRAKDVVEYYARWWFGGRVGTAVSIVLVSAIFLFFYFVQGAFVLVWLFAIKMPAWLVAPLRVVWSFLWKKLQIGTFAKFMFSFVGKPFNLFRETVMLLMVRYFPGLAQRIRQRHKTEEEKRSARRKRARAAIARRHRHAHQAKNLKLYFAVRGDMTAWRRQVRARLRERLKRHRMWQKIIGRTRQGIPSLHPFSNHPGGYACCSPDLVLPVRQHVSELEYELQEELLEQAVEQAAR